LYKAKLKPFDLEKASSICLLGKDAKYSLCEICLTFHCHFSSIRCFSSFSILSTNASPLCKEINPTCSGALDGRASLGIFRLKKPCLGNPNPNICIEQLMDCGHLAAK
jgi:hypothetical protein